MSTIAPTWTDNVAVQAAYALIKGSGTTLQVARSTIDLRTKIGGMLFAAVATGGSTAIVVPCNAIVRRVLNNDGAAHKYSAPFWQSTSRTTSGVRLLNNGSNYAAGVQSFAFDGASGTAFAIGDQLFFWGVTTIPTSSGAISPAGGCEILRCAGGTTTPLLTDAVSKYLHNDNEFVSNADSWNVWLPGGSTYELIFDNTGCTAGEAIAVMADIQTYDTDTIT